MPRREDPDYVAKKKPPFKIQPPIVHPAFCVCRRCQALPDDERSAEHVFRVYRASIHPSSRVKSAAYALDVKRDTERQLRKDVEDALRVAETAAAAPLAPRFDAMCAAYEHHKEIEGKRKDYTVEKLLRYFGPDRDPTDITKSDHAEMVEHYRAQNLEPDTIGRHTRILLAILNSAVRDGLIPSHQLDGVRRPIVKRTKKPVTFTRRQVDVLLGPAMDRIEAEMRTAVAGYDPKTNHRPPTFVPLRGFCLIAYRTLMRPGNNFGLEWTQLAFVEHSSSGRFRLEENKNQTRGVVVEGALHRDLVDYFAARRREVPTTGSRFVHANPSTGVPYVNIRMHWQRLCEIANDILRGERSELLHDEQLHFYTWRHTGASRLAESGADPVMIVRMMGDVDLETVRAHYFDSSLEHMQRIMDRWDAPPAPAMPATLDTSRLDPEEAALLRRLLAKVAA